MILHLGILVHINKQHEEDRSLKKQTKLWVVTGIVILVGIVSWKVDSKLKEKKADDIRVRIQTVCNEYMQASGYARDLWWLKEAHQPGEGLARCLNVALGRVEVAVTNSAKASPLAKDISSAFESFLATEFINNNSVSVRRTSENIYDLKDALEICFIPKSEFLKYQLPSRLYYRQEWNAVMMAAIRWPDAFFSAVLMHEMGHAFYYKIGKCSPANSQGWFEEEVIMHELEAAVLDQYSKNQYSQKLSQICSEYASYDTVTEFIASVPASQLIELDKIIGVHNCGLDIKSLACGEHLAMIGFTFIDKKGGSIRDKVAYYKWIVEISS